MTVQQPMFLKQIKIGPRVFELRPNFACQMAIEDKAEVGILQIVKQFSKGDIRIKYVVAVIWGGLVGTAKELRLPMSITFEELGDHIAAYGWAKEAIQVQEFLSKCILGYASAVTEEAEDQEKRQKKTDETPSPSPTP